MIRTFHHRFTLGSKCGAILLALLAIFLFWVQAIIAGCILIVLHVLFIERVLHSEYVFNDDTLTIYRGRFSKTRVIRLADIKSCRPVKTAFGMGHFLLLGLANQQYVAVEPRQEASFVKHLQNRIATLSTSEAHDNADEA